MSAWIAPQTPPDEGPDPNAPMWREELVLVRECIPEALTPDTLRELRAREARLCLLLGEPMSADFLVAQAAYHSALDDVIALFRHRDAWRSEHETLAADLAECAGGTWTALVQCDDLIPGHFLDATPWRLTVSVGRLGPVRIIHPATTARLIAEALRDLPALRAWLLAELDAARVVVGGAS